MSQVHPETPARSATPESRAESVPNPPPDAAGAAPRQLPPEAPGRALFHALRTAGAEEEDAYTAVMEVKSFAGRNVVTRIEARLDTMAAQLTAQITAQVTAQLTAQWSAQLEAALAPIREQLKSHDARLTALEGAVRDLSAEISTALERSWATRRVVWASSDPSPCSSPARRSAPSSSG